MCGRFTLRRKLNLLLQEFDADIRGEPFDLFERYNICPTNRVPVIRQTDSGRELLRMQWGFVPSWAKDAKFCPINAVSETVAEKPMFRSAIKKRRCLVPADGFYEWKKIPKKIKGDSPWLFQVKGGNRSHSPGFGSSGTKATKAIKPKATKKTSSAIQPGLNQRPSKLIDSESPAAPHTVPQPTPRRNHSQPEQVADGEAEGAPVKTGEES